MVDTALNSTAYFEPHSTLYACMHFIYDPTSTPFELDIYGELRDSTRHTRTERLRDLC